MHDSQIEALFCNVAELRPRADERKDDALQAGLRKLLKDKEVADLVRELNTVLPELSAIHRRSA